MLEPFTVAFWLSAILFALFQFARARLDDSVARISRHWLPFLAFFFLCFAIAGHALNGLGIPWLFRDDPDLYDLCGWTAIRNSAVLWSQYFATLFLFAIWAFIYHFEILESAAASAARPGVTARRFVLLNGGPMLLFLLVAAAFPKHGDTLVAWADLAKAIAGVLLALATLWAVTALGKGLMNVLHRIGRNAQADNPHPMWCRLSQLVIGARHRPAAGESAEAQASFGSRSRRFIRNILQPPNVSEGRLAAIQAATSFSLVMIVSLVGVTAYPLIQSSVSMLLILAWLLTLYFSIAFAWPWLRLWVVVLLGLWIWFANQGPPHHVFPKLEDYYRAEQPVPIAPGEPSSGRRSPDALLEPLATLRQWRNGPGKACDNLVILATSGGAYRAGYWTAAVLDELTQRSAAGGELEGLADCIRVITGASGGMVGAAYYVAMRNQALWGEPMGSVIARLNADTKASRALGPFPTVTPYARDSLAPVAQQLAQRDLFHILLPRQTRSDRGIVLEKQWLTLDIPLAELREAEGEGLIPSLILSPMAFAGGAKPFAQPLLISNLKVDALGGPHWRYAFPFFALFPEVEDSFLLRTAVRMNATFPYVSPTVSLPTEPPARVVDAGYYDNYGLGTAASWLFSDLQPEVQGEQRPIDWLTDNGLGVVVIQIRAFPFQSSLPEHPGACYPVQSKEKETGGSGFQFLTTPLEALSAVRESGMNIRNEQQLSMVKALAGNERVHWVSFENAADVGMSWYLTRGEVDCLQQEVTSQYNRGQWQTLADIVNNAAGTSGN